MRKSSPPATISKKYKNFDDEDLISPIEFARLKKISLSTTKRMMYAGKLEYVQLSPRRIGIKMGVARTWQYPRAEVAEVAA